MKIWELLWIGVVLMSVYFYSKLNTFSDGDSKIATIESASGDVNLKFESAPLWFSANEGQTLSEGAILATGAASSSAIVFLNGSRLEVKSNTQIILRSNQLDQKIYPTVFLIQGKVRYVSAQNPPKSDSKINTTSTLTRLIDTFKVKIESNIEQNIGMDIFGKKALLDNNDNDVIVEATLPDKIEIAVLKGQLNLAGKSLNIASPAQVKKALTSFQSDIKKMPELIISKSQILDENIKYKLVRNWILKPLNDAILIEDKFLCSRSILRSECPEFDLIFQLNTKFDLSDSGVAFWIKLSREDGKKSKVVPLRMNESGRLMARFKSADFGDTKYAINSNTIDTVLHGSLGLSENGTDNDKIEFVDKRHSIRFTGLSDANIGLWQLHLAAPPPARLAPTNRATLWPSSKTNRNSLGVFESTSGKILGLLSETLPSVDLISFKKAQSEGSRQTQQSGYWVSSDEILLKYGANTLLQKERSLYYLNLVDAHYYFGGLGLEAIKTGQILLQENKRFFEHERVFVACKDGLKSLDPKVFLQNQLTVTFVSEICPWLVWPQPTDFTEKGFL